MAATPLTLALAGDTMLGRLVADTLEDEAPRDLVSADLADLVRAADLCILNLECCVSTRGEPWPAPGKPFFFRAPPRAVELLTYLGVDCVTLANNHALDFGEEALLDTLTYLDRAGIAAVGAGPDEAVARRFVALDSKGTRVAVVGVSDHPPDFAAGPERAGIAFADLRKGVPDWLATAIRGAGESTDAVVVTPHWGPNMVPGPVRHVRAAAEDLVRAGGTLVAGHSAHVPHGVGRLDPTEPSEVARPVLYDLGDFLDDYAVHPELRNDLGLLFLVTLDVGVRPARPVRLEAVPLALDFCHTRLATGDDATWMRDRFRSACDGLGTASREEDGHIVVDL